MLLVIAGDLPDDRPDILDDAFNSCCWRSITREIVSCGDRVVEDWARERGVPVQRFALETKYGGGALGYRNRKIAEYTANEGGNMLVVWDGRSHDNAANLIDQARACKVPTLIYYV